MNRINRLIALLEVHYGKASIPESSDLHPLARVMVEKTYLVRIPHSGPLDQFGWNPETLVGYKELRVEFKDF
jgi:hypothetical protein